MSTKPDIEYLLKRFRIDPAPHVKRAVLAKYAERFSRPKAAAGTAPFWRRPVPLYFTAALVIVAAGLSFAGGQRLSRRAAHHGVSSTAAEDTLIEGAPELEWSYAPRDLF